MDREQVIALLKETLTIEAYTWGNRNIEQNLAIKVLVDGDVIQEVNVSLR